MKIELKENVNISADLNKLLDEHSVASGQEILNYETEHFSFALYRAEELIGGLIAKSRQGEFYIQLLAVAKEYRKQGLGKRLMLVAEAKARDMNCHHMLLTTTSYQGVHFYPKLGYEELARISNFPAQAVDKIYFIKYLKSI